MTIPRTPSNRPLSVGLRTISRGGRLWAGVTLCAAVFAPLMAAAAEGMEAPPTPAITVPAPGSNDPAGDPAKTDNPAEQRKAAEKTFTDLYGKDEQTAQHSRESEDNTALAVKIAKDATDSNIDPVLADVMRDHATNLLVSLRSVAGCDQAIQLREDEKNMPGADREAIQMRIVDLNTTAVKYMATTVEQMGGEKRVLLALSDLAEIQIHKRSFADAIKSLDRIRAMLGRTDANAAAQVSARIRQLQPLTQREMRVAKLKKDWQTKPGDKTTAGDLIKLLIQDWGDVMGTAQYLPAATGDEFKNIAPLLAFEESGADYTKATLDQVKDLAAGYDAWAADRQTGKLAQVSLLRRAVTAYTELARLSQGMDSIRAKQNASLTQDKLDAVEKDQSDLLTALASGITIDGSVSLSRIAGFDLGEIKAWDPQTKIVPRVDLQQMFQLSCGTTVGMTLIQGPQTPANVVQGYRMFICADSASGWVLCPTVVAPPSQRVVAFADPDGKSFWVWRSQNNLAVTLTRWVYDAARKDVTKQPGDLAGKLPNGMGDERAFVLGNDGSLMLTAGPVFQEGPRWMINQHILKYDMKKFSDPVMDLPVGTKTDSWRQRPIMMLINSVWYVYHQDGGKMDEMHWAKIENGKLVDLYKFQNNGNMAQLLPGKGASLHFFWDWNGRWWTSTWDGKQMSEEKWFVNWQQGMQRISVNAAAFGDQIAVLIVRSANGPQDANVKIGVSTMFRSQGNWSAEKPVNGSDNWLKTYGFWDPSCFRNDLNGLTIPLILGDHDLKAIANFKVAP